MLAKSYSFGILGLDAYCVTIELFLSRGLPATIIVGLPGSAIRESKERVRSAIKNSDFPYPRGRVTINLSPADVKKEGPSFDLAMALGLLSAHGHLNPSALKRYAILGELSLDGKVQPVKGLLPIATSSPMKNFAGLLCPTQNAQEAALAHHIDVFPIKSLSEAVYFLNNPL